jgi:branched-chain amino acid transport system permease protein
VNGTLSVLLLLFLVGAPWLLSLSGVEFWLAVLTEILIWGLFASSANLLLGQVGLLSFGQALFFGFGMYGIGIGIDRFGLSLWPALAIALVASVGVAGFVGAFAVRLTWHYFAIMTVVFSLVFYYLALRLKPITGGDDGLSFPAPEILSFAGHTWNFNNGVDQYFFVLLLVGLGVALQAWLRATPLGRNFAAVRESERKAALLGVNVLLVRWIAFVIAGGIAGLAGGLYSLFGRYASASYMFYHVSGEAVVWTIIGGTGTLAGPFLGAGLFTLMREELSSRWEHYPILVGALVILTVLLAPQGIAGTWNAALAALGRRERL